MNSAVDIQRISKRMLFVFNFILLILPVVVIFPWLFPNTWLGNFLFGFSEVARAAPDLNKFIKQLQLNNIILGFVASLLSLLPLAFGVLVLIKLFRNYADGEVFMIQNVKYYRQLGYICLLSALIFQPLSEAVTALCISINNSPGHRYITIGFSNTNFTALICGIILVIISRVMLIGYNISEEQKYTV